MLKVQLITEKLPPDGSRNFAQVPRTSTIQQGDVEFQSHATSHRG